MKGTGPHKNRNYYLQDRPRALFSDMPIGFDLNDYCSFEDDFRGTLSTIEWETVKDSGASVANLADGENGAVVITSAATTSGDGGLIQAINTNFLCVAGRYLAFEARVKVSDADQGPMFVGLADTAATDPEAVVVAGLARVGFELLDEAATVNIVVDNDTAATKTITSVSMADATYIQLGFRIMNDVILYYINRQYVGYLSLPSAIAAVTLGPAFMHISGNASGTHTAHCDYIRVISARV